ncbi:hypothetical protein SERLA73DRAFT_133722, partial [Serpula lacrymans var. lacrymans S7.3]
MRSFIFLSVFSGLLLSVCRDAGFAVAQNLKKAHARPRVLGHNRALPEMNGTAIGVSDTALSKRDGSSRFTYFQDGTGACGVFNQPSDYIVALNSAQFDGGAHCFAMITITVGDKTTQAQITDEVSIFSPIIQPSATQNLIIKHKQVSWLSVPRS